MPNIAPTASINPNGGSTPLGNPIGTGPVLSTILPNGDVAVTWGFSDIFLQIFAPDGTARTGVITANTATLDAQFSPDITVLSNGRVLIVWQDQSMGVGGAGGDTSSSAIKAQLFDSNGARIGDEFLVNSSTTGTQLRPLATPTLDGGFVIGWYDSNGGDIRAQAYDASGARSGGEVLVNTVTTGSQGFGDIETLANGNVVFVWDDFSHIGNSPIITVRGQLLAPTGGLVGSEFVVPTSSYAYQRAGEIAALDNGGFAVIWNYDFGSGQNDIGLRLFDQFGAPVTGEIQVNAHAPPTPGDGYQYRETIETLVDGRFVVAWSDYSRGQIRAQIFGADGSRAGDELVVGSYVQTVDGGQLVLAVPDLVALADGGFVVAWGYDNSPLFAREFEADGTPTSEQFVVTADAGGEGVSATPWSGDDYLLSWDDNAQRYGGDSYRTFTQAPHHLEGTLSVADPDSGGGIETVVLSVDFGILDVDAGASGATVSNSGTDAVTITGTIAQINALLSGVPNSFVVFNGNFPSPPSQATLTMTVNDNGNSDGAPLTGTDTATILLTVDQPPVVTPGSGSASFREATSGPPSPVVVAPSLTVTDPDHSTIKSAKVQIAVNYAAGQDVLALGATSGIGNILASFDSATGTLSLVSPDQSATLFQWQRALRSVTFANLSDGPSTAVRTITFSANDGVIAGNPAGRNVTVTGTNDAPVLDLNGQSDGAGTTLVYRTLSQPAAIAPAAILADPDSLDFTGGQLVVAQSGNASPSATLSILNQGSGDGQIGIAGNAVSYEGVTIGTFGGGNGLDALVVGLNGNATSEAGQALLRAIAYSNSAYAPTTLRFTLSDGDGGSSVPVTANVFAGVAKSSFASPASWTTATPPAGQGWYVGDFDGDLKDDVFRTAPGGYGADVFLSTGSAFASAGLWTSAGIGSDGRFYVGDFTGDGRDDMLRHLDGTGAQVLESNGSGFVFDGTWTPAGRGSGGRWLVGDFNGDDKDDILRHIDGVGAQVLESNGSSFAFDGTWTPAGSGSDGLFHVGDFNGDGKDDIARYLEGTGLQVLLSNGNAFVFAGTWTGAGPGSDGTFEFGDFNGDGKDDIARHLAGTGTQVFISTGGAFAFDGTWSTAAAGADFSLAVGDFDGNGNSDLLRVLPGSTDIFL